MLQKLLFQLKTFSQENWGIYVLLFLAVTVVFFTGKGDIIEIVLLFILNLVAALFNMLMMSSYKQGSFKEGSIFILTANILYTFLSCYAFFVDGDTQYLFWQVPFLLTGIQSVSFYNYGYMIPFINMYSILGLNICILLYMGFSGIFPLSILIQSLGLAFITFGIVLKNDIKRYFSILVGNNFVVIGSSYILTENYLEGAVLGVTLGYTLLAISICAYNYRILPTYISRLKNRG